MESLDINGIRALLAAKPRPVGWTARRARLDEIGSLWPAAADVTLTPVSIGELSAEWSSVPGSDAARVLMFLHGGGYCSGSILSHRRMVTEAGRAAGVRTFAVGYRLAPEHPFPAALDDALTAWHFLRREGIAAGRIAVGGDSAGGGLSLALALQLRDSGEPLPGCLWLSSPWVDLTLSAATLATRSAVDPLIHKDYLGELADAYLGGTATERNDPRVSPLFANLAAMPPTLIQVGSAETLLDDAVRLAGALGAADVGVTLEVWPHMIHAWALWSACLDAGRAALADAGAFVRRHLG